MKKLTVNNDRVEIKCRINNTEINDEVKLNESLLDFIRRKGFKGTKKGCDSGDCGSCAVMMDKKVVVSCVIPAFMADGKEIITIEGLGTLSDPHPIQKAFVETGAVQCGFCVPGMIMTTKFLLDRIPNPDEETIKHYLDGNLCRCTGYVKQIEAVKLAAKKIKMKR